MIVEIFVSSTSSHKLEAVQEAVAKIFGESKVEVEGRKVPSGVDEQPVGWGETIKGARQRLGNLREKLEKEEQRYDYLVSIENGIIPIEIDGKDRWFDVGVVIVENKSGSGQLSFSASVEMPLSLVALAQEKGFETATVGSLIAEKFEGDATDPHSVLTDKQINRKELLEQTVRSAFGELIFKKKASKNLPTSLRQN